MEGGHWWLSFAAEDSAVTMPGKTVDAATEQIAKDLRHLSAEQLAERTLGGDRGVAKPLVTSDGQVFDRLEDLRIKQMTKRPKVKKDVRGRFLPNGRAAKAGLHRAILASAWGRVVAFTRYKALRQGKLVITVPPQHGSQECAVCAFTSPDNRRSQAEFVCQRCGHRDNADHNAVVVIARRGIDKLLANEPLTKTRQSTRIFRKLGPERSEVTPGEILVRRLSPMAASQGSQNQEPPGAIPETPASAS